MPGSFPGRTSKGGLRRLCPVILRVPTHLQNLRGRAQVAILSRLARMAVRLSARLTGVVPPADVKDALGAPQPRGGIHWSVTHKLEFVAGVVADAPVGIDIEPVRSPNEALYNRIATVEEWHLSRDPQAPRLFYRVWTAKEAVLKAEGVGLRGLSRCRVTAIPDQRTMRLAFDGRNWTVAHHYFETHVVALTGTDAAIEWRVDPGVSPGATRAPAATGRTGCNRFSRGEFKD